MKYSDYTKRLHEERMEGPKESIRDILKRREEREEARTLVSQAARKRAKRAERIERDRHHVVFTLNNAQALCLWDLICKFGRGSEATIVDKDNYGNIRIFITRENDNLPPAMYKLLKSGGVEVLEDQRPAVEVPEEPEEELI